jgi:hypothetical protein
LKRATWVALCIAAATGRAAAESDHAMSVSAGLGFAFPSAEIKGSGEGLYLAGEYVYRRTEWLTPRAYAGLLITRPQGDCGAGPATCDVSAQIFFLGAKVRLLAPIPYVAPFIELGLGASLGHLSTISGNAVDVTSNGIFYNVPFTLGLALGGNHQFELEFTYLFHPEQQQMSGAAAVGLTFPIG